MLLTARRDERPDGSSLLADESRSRARVRPSAVGIGDVAPGEVAQRTSSWEELIAHTRALPGGHQAPGARPAVGPPRQRPVRPTLVALSYSVAFAGDKPTEHPQKHLVAEVGVLRATE